MSTVRALIDPRTLNYDQLHEQACALCGARLYRDQPFGPVVIELGGMRLKFDLWVCAPECEAPQS